MSNKTAELEKSTIEHAAGAFESFCEDISGMFGISVEGTASDRQIVTLKELKSDFKKITAVFIAESKGVINGRFYILLDQDALFTLAGTFVMLPEKIIVQNRRTGKEKEANEVADAVGEVGNLLVGAWDKYFREEMEGHEHFLQTGTFIGKPWLKPEENVGLEKETELVAVKYEMKIESFDPVVCMAAFPKSVFQEQPAEEETTEDTAENSTEQSAEDTDEQAKAGETVTEPEAKKESNVEETDQAQKDSEIDQTDDKPAESVEQTDDQPAEPEEKAGEQPAADDESSAEETQELQQTDEQQSAEEPAEQAIEETAEAAVETVTEAVAEDRPVSKVIEQMTHSPAVLPGEITGDFLTDIQAQNVMRTDIAWATQDDTVENVLTQMQQQNTGYALVGTLCSVQGIISKSDIQGALSPYLQSIFSKWKRELDTATLQIKVRWIMSRPVHTVRPEATLADVMETMCKHSVRALPVADENGVCGIVTVYTIFNALNAAVAENADQQGQNTDVPALS